MIFNPVWRVSAMLLLVTVANKRKYIAEMTSSVVRFITDIMEVPPVVSEC